MGARKGEHPTHRSPSLATTHWTATGRRTSRLDGQRWPAHLGRRPHIDGAKAPMTPHVNATPASTPWSLTDDGVALAAEADQARTEMARLRHRIAEAVIAHLAGRTTDLDEVADLRTYYAFLNARLAVIERTMRALCRQCLGTGRVQHQHLVYPSCPSCSRRNRALAKPRSDADI